MSGPDGRRLSIIIEVSPVGGYGGSYILPSRFIYLSRPLIYLQEVRGRHAVRSSKLCLSIGRISVQDASARSSAVRGAHEVELLAVDSVIRARHAEAASPRVLSLQDQGVVVCSALASSRISAERPLTTSQSHQNQSQPFAITARRSPRSLGSASRHFATRIPIHAANDRYQRIVPHPFVPPGPPLQDVASFPLCECCNAQI